MPRGKRPLRPGDDVVVEFARGYAVCGSQPGYRQIANSVVGRISRQRHCRRTHVDEVAQFWRSRWRMWPPVGDTAEWEARWRHTTTQLAASTPTKLETPNTLPEANGEGPTPWVGLAQSHVDSGLAALSGA